MPEPLLHRAADGAKPGPVECEVDGVLRQDPVELHHPQPLRDAGDAERSLAPGSPHGRVVDHRRGEPEDAVEEEPDRSGDDGADQERSDAVDLQHRRQGEQREQDRVDRDHDQAERLQDVRQEQKLEHRSDQSAEDAEDGGKPQDRHQFVRRVQLEPGQKHDQQADHDRVRQELNERDPPVETRQRSPRRHVWHVTGHRSDSTVPFDRDRIDVSECSPVRATPLRLASFVALPLAPSTAGDHDPGMAAAARSDLLEREAELAALEASLSRYVQDPDASCSSWARPASARARSCGSFCAEAAASTPCVHGCVRSALHAAAARAVRRRRAGDGWDSRRPRSPRAKSVQPRGVTRRGTHASTAHDRLAGRRSLGGRGHARRHSLRRRQDRAACCARRRDVSRRRARQRPTPCALSSGAWPRLPAFAASGCGRSLLALSAFSQIRTPQMPTSSIG